MLLSSFFQSLLSEHQRSENHCECDAGSDAEDGVGSDVWSNAGIDAVSEISGQYYKASTSVNYVSTVVITTKLLTFTTLDS